MAKIRKEVFVEAKVGDEIRVKGTYFRSDLPLFINHIEEGLSSSLIFYSFDKGLPKDECETAFDEDCFLV